MESISFATKKDIDDAIRFSRSFIKAIILRDNIRAVIMMPQLEEHHDYCIDILSEVDQMVHDELCALTLYLRDNSYWQSIA